jgi:hypothetical protein
MATRTWARAYPGLMYQPGSVPEYEGRLLDSSETPVSGELSEHVHFLRNPLSVTFDQLDDMAVGVTIAIKQLIQNSDRGALDNLSQGDDAR